MSGRVRSQQIKRAVDVIGAAGLLVATAPITAGVALAIRLRLGGPVVFRQSRPGLRGELFEMQKFRTMTDARDVEGNPLPDGERLTDLGRFLRATSLDELPTLLNVLRGQMSLVGPRPLLAEYLTLYSEEQARRHEVKPGITGWAQIHGRNAVSWAEKFRLDVWYVDNWSLVLDAKILVRTLGKVLAREGISQPGQATAQKFRGQGADD